MNAATTLLRSYCLPPPRRRAKPITVPAPHFGVWQPTHVKVQTQGYPCDHAPQTGEHATGAGGTARCVPMPHLDAIFAEARRVGWPTHFARDVFTHDRDLLSRTDPRVPFLWVLRECGSCLYPATTTSIDGVGHKAWHAPDFIVRAFGADRCRFYTWDGARLREHAGEHAVAEAVREMAESFGKLEGCAMHAAWSHS